MQKLKRKYYQALVATDEDRKAYAILRKALRERRKEFQDIDPSTMEKEEYCLRKSFCFYPEHRKGMIPNPFNEGTTYHVPRTKR